MWQHARVAWLSGLRSHGFVGVLVLGLLLMAGAFLAGAFSLRQPLVVSLDVGISGIRIFSLLLVLFWLQEVFAKDIDRRTVYFALSYPLSRQDYLWGRYIGVVGMLAVAVLLFGGLLLIMDHFAIWGYADSTRPFIDSRYALVLLGIFLDACTVGAFALAVMTFSETPFLAMALGFCFALAGRSMGAVLDYLTRPQAADAETIALWLPWLRRVAWALPDLSRLDWRSGILYDSWPAASLMWHAILMALAYIALMLLVASWRFGRREFN